MKLKTKIRAGMLCVFLLAVIMAGYSLFSVLQLSAFREERDMIADLHNDVQGHVIAHQQWLYNFLFAFTYDEEFTGSLDPDTCIFGRWYHGSYARQIEDDRILELLQVIDQPHRDLHIQGGIALQLRADGRHDEARLLARDVILPAGAESIYYLTALSNHFEYLLDAQAEITSVWAVNTGIVIASISVASLLVFIGLSILIPHSILKPINRLAAAATCIARGNVNVNIDTKGPNDEIGQLSSSFAGIVESLNIMQESFRKSAYAHQHGNILYRLDDSRLEGTYSELIKQTNDIIHEFVLTFDNLSEPFLYIDNNFRILYANTIAQEHTGINVKDIIGMHLNDLVGYDLAGHPATVKAFTNAQAQYGIDVQLQLNPNKLFDISYSLVPFEYDGKVVCALLELADMTRIVDIQRNAEKLSIYRDKLNTKFTENLVDALESGNLALHFPGNDDYYDDATKEVAKEHDSLESVVGQSIGAIKSYVDEITEKLREIADNSFDITIDREYVGDFGSIKDSLVMITESVSALVHEIQMASAEVEQGADQISQSTQGLMASFQEQAAAMSEVTDAISILTEKTQKNAEDAQAANQLSEQVRQAATSGTQHMSDMSTAMAEIKQSSAEIAKVVGIIDSIAFQTNLLALNASVEAARAGEHGKGFSVVAEEVRTLAGRSAAAAKDTAAMLEESMNRVDLGVAKSEQTSEALHEIVEKTANVADVVANIAQVSSEQAEEISKIQNSMEAVHSGTSINSASVQSNASVSEELSSQASMLRSLTGQFKINRR